MWLFIRSIGYGSIGIMWILAGSSRFFQSMEYQKSGDLVESITYGFISLGEFGLGLSFLSMFINYAVHGSVVKRVTLIEKGGASCPNDSASV